MSSATRNRPKFLNLFQIRLPLPGVVSFLHRVSGAGMFLMLPLVLWLFSAGLGTQESFAGFKAAIGNPVVKLLFTLVMAGYFYHFCAGIRFLFLDMHVGVDLPKARRSSVMVLAAAVLLTLIFGAKLW